MMNKFLKFFKSNICGIILSCAIGIFAAVLCKFNIVICMLAFLAGYFIVGIIVEAVTDYFTVKRTTENALKPDNRVKRRTLGSIKVDFVTNVNDEDEGEDPAENKSDNKADSKANNN